MTDHHNPSKMEGVNQCREVLRVDNGRVSGTGRIYIRIVVPSAIRDCPIMLSKRADLVCPILAITQRPVDKNYWRSLARFHVVQSGAVSNIDGSYDRCIGVR